MGGKLWRWLGGLGTAVLAIVLAWEITHRPQVLGVVWTAFLRIAGGAWSAITYPVRIPAAIVVLAGCWLALVVGRLFWRRAAKGPTFVRVAPMDGKPVAQAQSVPLRQWPPITGFEENAIAALAQAYGREGLTAADVANRLHISTLQADQTLNLLWGRAFLARVPARGRLACELNAAGRTYALAKGYGVTP